MLSGHAASLHQRSDSGELLEDLISESDEEDSERYGKILYRASFTDLETNNLKYDTIIWILVSLLLLMASGLGLLLLLYLPYKRYVLKKEISSRILYVTEDYIVYKAFRPSYLPFLSPVKIKNRVPLHLVLEIIIEQGCLQSIYELHTVRIKSRIQGKPFPIDELQFQGVSNPQLLRKVIVREAARNLKETGSKMMMSALVEGQLSTPRMRSHSEVPAFNRLLSSPSYKVRTPRQGLSVGGAIIPADLFLHKLEEVNQSVKKIQSLVDGSQK